MKPQCKPPTNSNLKLLHEGMVDLMETDMEPARELCQQKISYKSKLTGVIPGAFEKAF